MNSISRTIGAAIFGIALFLNLVAFVALQGVLGQNLTAIAQPLATLFAGIVGLGAIAYQARIGFANLVAGQEHRANIERQAREHQADIERRAAEDDDRRRRVSIARALKAEATANITALKDFQNRTSIAISTYSGAALTSYEDVPFPAMRHSSSIYDGYINEAAMTLHGATETLIDAYSHIKTVGERIVVAHTEELFIKANEIQSERAETAKLLFDVAVSKIDVLLLSGL